MNFFSTKSWLSLLLFCLLALGFGFAEASDVVLVSGTRHQNVRIVSKTPDSLTIETPYGIVKLPISAVATIDGQPAVPPIPTPTPEPTAVPTPPPVPAMQWSPPEPLQSALTPEPPQLPQTNPAGAEIPGLQIPAAMPAPAPEKETVAENLPAQKERPPLRFNYEFVLVCFLIGGSIWMRSLTAVQQDLFDRRMDPRFWTTFCLVLPIAGSALYFAAMRWGDLRESKAPSAAGPDRGSETKAPAKKPDPAAYLSKKGKTRKGFEFLDSDRKSITQPSGKDTEASSGLESAKELLEEALMESASDVHIEPTSAAYRVRFRLDGILHERMSYDSVDGKRLVTSLKSLAQIDIAEKRKAQDGHFRVRADERDIDFRVATTNSLYGEKMVIRILDHKSGVYDLTSLGLSDAYLKVFRQVIGSRSGMILATGPTGSGKTSTLYAAVRQLDTTSLNIMTIEDPAEYELSSITQIAVNPRAGITYESGLRSILRQDPDVILVGEMRDAEAAEIAMRAALTGHLVLSSLHTKDAIGTISRLQDMKIERYQAASALLMVLAQRLVRVLCPDCRIEYSAEGNELEELGLQLEPGSILYKPSGCKNCRGTGFKGRTGIFELLVLNDELRRMVGEGADESTLFAAAAERGFESYRADGARKALMGITTIEEVLQAG